MWAISASWACNNAISISAFLWAWKLSLCCQLFSCLRPYHIIIRGMFAIIISLYWGYPLLTINEVPFKTFFFGLLKLMILENNSLEFRKGHSPKYQLSYRNLLVTFSIFGADDESRQICNTIMLKVALGSVHWLYIGSPISEMFWSKFIISSRDVLRTLEIALSISIF